MDLSRSSLEFVASGPEEKHIHYHEQCLCMCFCEGFLVADVRKHTVKCWANIHEERNNDK